MQFLESIQQVHSLASRVFVEAKQVTEMMENGSSGVPTKLLTAKVLGWKLLCPKHGAQHRYTAKKTLLSIMISYDLHQLMCKNIQVESRTAPFSHKNIWNPGTPKNIHPSWCVCVCKC